MATTAVAERLLSISDIDWLASAGIVDIAFKDGHSPRLSVDRTRIKFVLEVVYYGAFFEQLGPVYVPGDVPQGATGLLLMASGGDEVFELVYQDELGRWNKSGIRTAEANLEVRPITESDIETPSFVESIRIVSQPPVQGLNRTLIVDITYSDSPDDTKTDEEVALIRIHPLATKFSLAYRRGAPGRKGKWVLKETAYAPLP